MILLILVFYKIFFENELWIGVVLENKTRLLRLDLSFLVIP